MMQHYRTHLSQKFRRHQMRHQQPKKGKEEHPTPQLYCHSYHGRENAMSLQPLMNRHRSVTMPSMPYPTMMVQQKTVNRPRRALSTSSTCSSSSSSSSSSPPSPAYFDYQQHYPILPPPMPFIRQPMIHHQKEEHRHNEWTPNQKHSSLLQLANIVSTFG
jgi:hypothetical protein